MKRVQINETSEYYLPQIRRELSTQNKPDLMLGILDEFDKAWQADNKWMLHILTKRPSPPVEHSQRIRLRICRCRQETLQSWDSNAEVQTNCESFRPLR